MKTFLIIFVLTNATLILAQEFDVAQKPQQTRIGVGIMLTEQFKPIKDYEDHYEISNFGRVKSLFKEWIIYRGGIRKQPERMLKPGINSSGYYTVILCKNGNIKSHSIHHLVWDHFGDKKRNGNKLQIDHSDNNKLNNRLDNLQLLPPRGNISKSKLLTKKSGLPTGVVKNGKGFQARIWIKDKNIYLGTFPTPEEASNVYQNDWRI